MMVELRPDEHALRRFPGAVEFDGATDAVVIGVVAPFDFEMDWEYIRALPDGVQPYFTRTPYVDLPVNIDLARRVGEPSVVAEATRSLQYLNPAATLYACASGSFVRGLDGERVLRETMLEAGAQHAITTSSALLDALTRFSIGRVALALPYSEGLARQQAAFLEDAGVEVTRTVYLGVEDDIPRVSADTIRALAHEACRGADADAIFVGCTSLRTFGLVGDLEKKLGCPVFTANQVSLWRTLLDADPGTVTRARRCLCAGDEEAVSGQLLVSTAEG